MRCAGKGNAKEATRELDGRASKSKQLSDDSIQDVAKILKLLR